MKRKTFAAKSLACLLALMLVCCTLVIAPAAEGTNEQYNIAYSKKAPTIDGEISPNEYGKYSIVSWSVEDGDKDGFNKKLYKLTDDPELSIDFYATWTDDNLYLAWKVHTKYDVRLPQDKTDNYMYENCCVQFILTPGAPDNTVKKYQTSEWSGDYLEIGICLRDDGESYKCCWSQPVAANDGLTLTDWEAQARRDEAAQDTIYECRIPWGKSGIESKGDGAQFGLTFGVGVQEDYNKTAGMIEWQDAILEKKEVDNSAIMTLTESGQGQQGIQIQVTNKEDAPVGELPDGLTESLLTIDNINVSITAGKTTLVTDPSKVASYNGKYAVAVLLRPEDASKVDGYYTVVETITGAGEDPKFADVKKGDLLLLAHADETSSEEARARRAVAAELTVGQQCYLFGFQKDKEGTIGWKYKNAQLIPILSPSAMLCNTWVAADGEAISFVSDGTGAKAAKLLSEGTAFKWTMSDDEELKIDDKKATWKVESGKLTLDGKEYAQVNVTKLTEILERVEALKETGYTADSWKKLQDAVKTATEGTLSDQAAIDKAATAIETAFKALASVDSDTSKDTSKPSEASQTVSVTTSSAPTPSGAPAEEGGLPTFAIVLIIIGCVAVVAVVVVVIVMRKKKAE